MTWLNNWVDSRLFFKNHVGVKHFYCDEKKICLKGKYIWKGTKFQFDKNKCLHCDYWFNVFSLGADLKGHKKSQTSEKLLYSKQWFWALVSISPVGDAYALPAMNMCYFSSFWGNTYASPVMRMCCLKKLWKIFNSQFARELEQ